MQNLVSLIDCTNKVSMIHHYAALSDNDTLKGKDVSIIIPVRGRLHFLKPLVKSLLDAAKPIKETVNITIVEHSSTPSFKTTSKDLSINYYWIKANEDEPFNKSLCHNIGAMINKKSKYFLFHDLDCLVFNDFFVNIFQTIKDKNAFALQTFKERRLLYLTDDLTSKIINGIINHNDISITDATLHKGDCCAPGGSILVKNELFTEIGGFDPEFFFGYSPEDLFFWVKMETFFEVHSASNEVLHMSHERMENTNDKFDDMLYMYELFNGLDKPNKLKFLAYKRDITLKYML